MSTVDAAPGGKSLIVDLEGPLHVVDYGGSGPPLVLIHGLGGSHLNWMLVARPLTEWFRVVALDLPGFGLTAPEGRSSDVRDQAALVSRYIDEHLGEAAYVAGNSMGGLVALLAADVTPELIRGLILIDPALPPDTLRMPSGDTVRFLAMPLLPFVGVGMIERQRNKQPVPERVRETMEYLTADPSRIPQQVLTAGEAMEEARREMPWSIPAFVDAGRSIAKVLSRRGAFLAMIHRIGAPVLMIHGKLDEVVPVEFARKVADERPEWELVVYDDVGHVPQLETPDRVVATVVNWQRRAAARATAV
jgi:pimeloyl-ACP methyl ester carboxylesterase